MNISKRHHYVPQFLIRQFADENGLLWVYDKQYDSFSKDKKSTKSIFFEMNRNTLEIDGTATDVMEKLYASLDDYMARSLNDILKNKRLTPEIVAEVLILINMLKWRIPQNDDEFEKLKSELSYEKLPFEINLRGTDQEIEKEALDHLTKSELFNFSKRVIFPFLPFYKGEKWNEDQLLEIATKSYINSNDKIQSILGDVPYIEKDTAEVNQFTNIIFPLSGTDTFIYADGNGRISNIAFYLSKDLAIFHRSSRYVAAKNRDHLETVVNTYKSLAAAHALSLIDKYVFDFV